MSSWSHGRVKIHDPEKFVSDSYHFLSVAHPLDGFPDGVIKLLIEQQDNAIVVNAFEFATDGDYRPIYKKPLAHVYLDKNRLHRYAKEELSLVDFRAYPPRAPPGFGRFLLISALRFLVTDGEIDDYTVVGVYVDGMRAGKPITDLFSKVYEPLGFRRVWVWDWHEFHNYTARSTVGQIIESYRQMSE
jgi:hypothetical protein